MRKLALLAMFGLLAGIASQPPPQILRQRDTDKDQEETRQVRELPKELPLAVSAETSRLEFLVSPLSARGLLSQQIRDGLRALFQQAGSARIVRLRAFVAGTGDMRRVLSIVSDTFTERRYPLPVATVIQAGALPLTGAQVVMEAAAVSRDRVNPHGVAFLSAQLALSQDLSTPMRPLVEKSLAELGSSLAAAKLAGGDVLQATCFLSSLEGIDGVRQLVSSRYPRARLNFVQPLRATSQAMAACEAAARLGEPPGEPLRFLNAPGGEPTPGFSRVVLVSAGRVALTGGQLAFDSQDQDTRLAFQRLGKTLEKAASSLDRAAVISFYVLTSPAADRIRRIAPEFIDQARPPAGAMRIVESLPSPDASFAMDVVAVSTHSD